MVLQWAIKAKGFIHLNKNHFVENHKVDRKTSGISLRQNYIRPSYLGF
jgi:hypothetical protein